MAYYNDGRESTPTIPFIANLTNEIKPVINKSILTINKNEIKLNAKGKLSLYAVNGQLIAKEKQGVIQLKGIPSGIYIVLIEYNNQKLTQKIIINN